MKLFMKKAVDYLQQKKKVLVLKGGIQVVVVDQRLRGLDVVVQQGEVDHRRRLVGAPLLHQVRIDLGQVLQGGLRS